MSTQIDFEFNDEEKYVQRPVSCRYRCKGELQLKFLIDKVIGRPANKNFLQLSSIIYNSRPCAVLVFILQIFKIKGSILRKKLVND